MKALPFDEWTETQVAELEAWRLSLGASLLAALSAAITVEFLTYRDHQDNEIRRFVNIYVGPVPTKVSIEFPEPIEDIVARVLEAIK